MSKCIFRLIPKFRFTFYEILRAGVCVLVGDRHPGLSSNFRGADSRLSVIVCLYGIIQKECVLVEVIFGFLLRNSGSVSELIGRNLNSNIT